MVNILKIPPRSLGDGDLRMPKKFKNYPNSVKILNPHPKKYRNI